MQPLLQDYQRLKNAEMEAKAQKAQADALVSEGKPAVEDRKLAQGDRALDIKEKEAGKPSGDARAKTAEDNRNDARLKDHPFFKKGGVPRWAFDNPDLVSILETLPPKVHADKEGPNAEKAKKFYEAVQNVPPNLRDAFLEEWVDEDGDVDVAEWLKDNE